jgi:CHAT domain
MSWERLHRLTGEAAAIDAAVAWLTEACQEFSAQPDQPEYANCLNQLAQAHRVRGNTARARETGLAALRVRGREVLLQTGTARGLGFARTAAAGAAELASWCIDDGQPAEALDALELGRGLILHAATTVTSVPEMLIAVGRADLAGEWRRGAASNPDAPWDASLADASLGAAGLNAVGVAGPGLDGASQAGGLLAGTAPLRVPSDLRARALAVLVGSAGEQLLAAPARAAVAAALVSTGADALIYLLGPAGDRAGCAIIMPAVIRSADAAPQVIMLPALRDSAGGAIDAYAAAQAALLAFPARPPGDRQDPAVQRWQAAETLAVSQRKHSLEALCAWAWPAVMGPLLDRARQWGLDHPPRLVLIPAGRLSLVPWHAACGPANGSGQSRHACAEAVISYAASSRQLIEVSRRPVLSLQASPVIVGDPTLDLPFAGLEALAIWEHCYPAARFLGHPGSLAARDADGSGAPDEVLAQLPAATHPGASMLHLGCHADVVTSAPGRSHLLLAGRQQLMLESVLRRASGRPSDAPGGLVSLAACRSDLAAADYDEALTLATAFLAAGAVTVVGAHWEVPDGATSLLIFMFHHFLAAGAQSPRDALRLAQLWMLDPHRAAPAEMPAYLAKDAGRADLAEVTAWAALTHQGR